MLSGRHFLPAVVLLSSLPAAAQNPAAELEAPTVEVIGTTPLPGLGTPVNQVPANVQATTGNEIQKQSPSNLGEFLDNNLGSVSVNHGQNNPFQPDVNFRGLTASPLLGTPQGLSVFMDGVRINEPFGDVVNWDFVPQNAISTINLIPGSNPVFGLNTLGGALSINTKSGFQYPGGWISAQAGSWGRKVAELEYGGHSEKNDWFVAGTWFDEEGWRDHSPSEVRQLFAKIGREEAETDFDLSIMLADNDLQGTQALPMSYLGNREQAYTWPDQNENRLLFVNARASHFLKEDLLLGGNLYVRTYENKNFSSNVNDNYDDTGAAGEDCGENLVGGTGPEACNDRSKIDTTGFGGSLQLSFLQALAGKQNQLTIGLSADLGQSEFSQTAEDASFTADRGTVGTGTIFDQTAAETNNAYYGLYFTDTYSVQDNLHLTLSGRYNYASIKIEDQSGSAPELNGDHSFSRFNPAVGVNYNPSASLTTYLAYSEGMRAPTPIELTCADPLAPCRLPNNFLADPPLKKVVSRTIETGARGKLTNDLGWSVGLYNTDLNDDIHFISAGTGATNAGFFQNVGKTRRRGGEAGMHGAHGPWQWMANYSYVRATFESSFLVTSPSNTSATDIDGDTELDDILVSPGNRLPGIPEHALKLRAEYRFFEKLSLAASMNYFSSQYARGDENNQDANGRIPGYTLVHLDGRYQASKRLEIFGRIQNLFDKEYESLGVLGENVFPGGVFDPANEIDEQFRSVGAPRAAWVGLRYQFTQ